MPRVQLFHDCAYDDAASAAPPTARSLRARLASAGLAALAAACLATIQLLVSHYRWLPSPLAAQPLGLTALVVAATTVQLVPRRWRVATLAIGCALLVPTLLGLPGLAIVGYAGALILLARPRRRLGLRIALALALWALLPVACWTVWKGQASGGELRPVVLVWAGLAYGALYLLVEHRRAAPGRFSPWDDLLYVTALPRLVAPFFQPISPSLLKGTAGDMDGRRCARSLGLGLYGTALLLLAAASRRAPPWHPAGLQFGREFLVYYAAAAGHIFVAIAAFRALGMDLPSGFRWPFLSRSFAEFFRSWNHYVRDAVVSLFYYPLIGVLRRSLSPRATGIVAPYLAIFFGAFMLNDLLVPVVTSPEPLLALAQGANPVHLAVLFVYWSAIILPRQLGRRRRGPARTGWRRWLATALFLVLYLVVWRFAWGVRH